MRMPAFSWKISPFLFFPYCLHIAANQDAERRRTVTFEYDALNRRVRTIYPDDSFTVTEYSESCGQKASETDQGGKVTKFRYDASGRLIEAVRVSEGQEIGASYTYDEAGNKRFQTDPNANTTEWEYDHLGRVVSRTLPLGMSENFVYDPNGNIGEKTDFNNDKIIYEYDENNRLIKKTYPDASEVSFTYTPAGQRETVTDAGGVTEYDYDLRDRLKEVRNPDGSVISYTYDDAGNRTAVTVPSGTTSYIYDVLNRLEKVIAPDGGETIYTYDKVGNRKSISYPNGTSAEYMYDRLNRLIRLENRNASGDLISGYVYTLGPAGNRQRVGEVHSGRVVNYTYDDLYRLTEEDITDPVLGNDTISYTYDNFGNRLTKTDSSGTVSYTYDDNDRLVSEGSITYEYDDNGNTLSKSDGTETIFYNYDYENRLVFMQDTEGSTEYAYDADGIRVRSVTNSVVTNYLVDKNRAYAQVLEERDDAGSLSVSYVYGDDLISQNRGGSISYYHYDGLGSTRALTDASANVTDTYVYEAFGDLIEHTGSMENNYLFTGEQYDPNAGFYYLRARYYDPTNGRFASSDPFMGNMDDPISLHRYLYAHADPVNNTDPSGKMSLATTAQIPRLMNIVSKISMPSFTVAVKASAVAASLTVTAKIMSQMITEMSMDLEKGVASRIALSIMMREFLKFKSSSEFKRNGKHWIEWMGYSPPSPTPRGTSRILIGRYHAGSVRIDSYKGGGPGRLFEFKYGIGRNAKTKQGLFLFRADYLDYTKHPAPPKFGPHYHLRYGNVDQDHIPL